MKEKMDDILDILVQFVLDGGTEVIENQKFSKRTRVAICLLIILIFAVFIGFLVWTFITNNSILVRVIDAAIILFLVCYLISLWRKIK